MIKYFGTVLERFFCDKKVANKQYFCWWAELANKQTNKIWLQPILCVYVWTLWDWYFIFKGHQILVLLQLYVYTYNYLNVALDENKHFTYLYWGNIVWFFGENAISNHGTLITPSGSGPVSRDISSHPIKETVKPPGDFSFRQLSRVLQEWRRAIFIRFPSGSHPMPSTGPAI